eukprot:357987-Chlamydomonas_euryale.AAC.3
MAIMPAASGLSPQTLWSCLPSKHDVLFAPPRVLPVKLGRDCKQAAVKVFPATPVQGRKRAGGAVRSGDSGEGGGIRRYPGEGGIQAKGLSRRRRYPGEGGVQAKEVSRRRRYPGEGGIQAKEVSGEGIRAQWQAGRLPACQTPPGAGHKQCRPTPV